MEEAQGTASLMEEAVSASTPRNLEFEVSVSWHFWSLGPPGLVGKIRMNTKSGHDVK